MADENQKLLALNLVAAASLALLGFLLARPFTDEGIFLTGGWLTGQGLLPYQDFFDIHNPGIFFLLAPVYQVIGPSLIASRILVILVQAATLLALYTLARRMFDDRTALLATAIHAVWLPVFYGFQLTIEPFSTFASTMAVLMFHRVALEGKRRITDVLLLGGTLGLAFLFKQTMLLLAVGLLVVFAWHLMVTRGTRSLLSKKAGLLIAALLALPLAILGIYALHGAGPELVWQTWGYNLAHAGILSNTAFKVEYVLVPVLLLFFTPLGLVWAVRKGFHPEDPRFWERLLLFAWLVFSLPNVFPLVGCCHHLMPLSPAAALVSAGVVMKLLAGDKRNLLAGAVGVLLLMAGLSMYVGLNHFGKDEFRPAQEIAAFVKENSAPQDRLMVFHHNAEIYFLSERKPATHYLYYPYFLPEEFAAFQDELRWQLELNPPELVVDFSGNGEPLNPDGKAEAEQWVLDRYEKVKEFRFDPPYNDYYRYAFVYQRKG